MILIFPSHGYRLSIREARRGQSRPQDLALPEQPPRERGDVGAEVDFVTNAGFVVCFAELAATPCALRDHGTCAAVMRFDHRDRDRSHAAAAGDRRTIERDPSVAAPVDGDRVHRYDHACGRRWGAIAVRRWGRIVGGEDREVCLAGGAGDRGTSVAGGVVPMTMSATSSAVIMTSISSRPDSSPPAREGPRAVCLQPAQSHDRPQDRRKRRLS